MEVIGDGAFSGLPSLKEFYAIRNIYLREIHPNAFARPDPDVKDRLDYPPIEKFIIHNNNLSYLEHNLFGKTLVIIYQLLVQTFLMVIIFSQLDGRTSK